MIALVAGEVAVRRGDHVVLETASGVGYRLAVSAETLKRVPPVGGTISLHTELFLRDDRLQLFGFASEAERELFGMLLGVQSVGPKVALAVLSGGTVRDLLRALAAGDVARFQAVPGIGRRTAERIIVELREKVIAAGETEAPVPDGAAADGEDPRTLARDGLVELGYAVAEAEALLREADGDSPEVLITQALRAAARG